MTDCETLDEQMILSLVGYDWERGSWIIVAHSIFSARTALNFVAPDAPVLKDLEFLACIVQDQLRYADDYRRKQ